MSAPAGGLNLDALWTLRAWVPPTPDQARLRERYVAHLQARPDGLERGCRPDHLTASVLVLDEAGERVLLTLHAKSGRWFQLGGHLEGGDETLAGGALREAVEESGIDAADLRLDPVPVVLDEHAVPFCGPDATTSHLDVMFTATARNGVAHAVSEESLDVAWWPVTELPNRELAPFVELALARRAQDGAQAPGSSSTTPATTSSTSTAPSPAALSAALSASPSSVSSPGGGSRRAAAE